MLSMLEFFNKFSYFFLWQIPLSLDRHYFSVNFRIITTYLMLLFFYGQKSFGNTFSLPIYMYMYPKPLIGIRL